MAIGTVLTSSRNHRLTQRSNVGAEIISTAAKSLTQQAAIPVKIGQSLISMYSLFTNHLKPGERAIQAMQALIAASHAGLLIALAFESDDECCESVATLCRLVLVSELAYQGLLVGSYAISEARKERDEVLPQDAP